MRDDDAKKRRPGRFFLIAGGLCGRRPGRLFLNFRERLRAIDEELNQPPQRRWPRPYFANDVARLPRLAAWARRQRDRVSPRPSEPATE